MRRLAEAGAASLWLLMVSLTSPVLATTYAWMPDEALADEATLIVGVEVLQILANVSDGIPKTDYLATVRQTYKGSQRRSTILVRVPGGTTEDGADLRQGLPEQNPN